MKPSRWHRAKIADLAAAEVIEAVLEEAGMIAIAEDLTDATTEADGIGNGVTEHNNQNNHSSHRVVVRYVSKRILRPNCNFGILSVVLFQNRGVV